MANYKDRVTMSIQRLLLTIDQSLLSQERKIRIMEEAALAGREIAQELPYVRLNVSSEDITLQAQTKEVIDSFYRVAAQCMGVAPETLREKESKALARISRLEQKIYDLEAYSDAQVPDPTEFPVTTLPLPEDEPLPPIQTITIIEEPTPKVVTPIRLDFSATPRLTKIIGNSNVRVRKELLGTEETDKTIARVFGTKIESHARIFSPLLATGQGNENAFLQAANLAYSFHYPLTITPDVIWLLIAQGFAQHINQNAERFRSRFVQHEGKRIIRVERDGFVKGSPLNDWEGVFSEFSDKIKEIVGEERHSLVVQNFSTTGILEKAAFEVTLMDALQAYFDYRVSTRCGIPYYNIVGEVDDWVRLRDAAMRLSEFDLEWWIRPLTALLDEFIRAAQGNSSDYWESFFKMNNKSGGPFIDGHITALFPYLYEDNVLQVNSWLLERPSGSGDGFTSDQVPVALSVAPFIWEYYRSEIPMEFVAGLVGISQNVNDFSLKPEMAWAVREK